LEASFQDLEAACEKLQQNTKQLNVFNVLYYIRASEV